MTISEPGLDSSNPCSNDIVKKHSGAGTGAGANAWSRTNVVLTTSPPLYELVWSKQKGLSHKSASSSSAEKRASLLRSTKTFDIVISSPNCNYGGERSDGCVRELSSLHSESHIEDRDYKKVMPISTPRSTCGPENCLATTDPSTRMEQICSLEVANGSSYRTTLECSKEVTKVITPTNLSSGSTSRATKEVLPTDGPIRTKFKKEKSHHTNWVGTFGSAFNYSRTSEMKKDKEPVIHDVDDSRSSSNRDNGHGNFECISSREIISTAKRARICDFESEKLIGGKKLKWQSNGNCSFMNWVTNITNGMTKHSKGGPMEFFKHPSLHVKGIVSPLSMSGKKKEDDDVSHGIRGFKSIHQGMYCPGYNAGSINNKYVDHRKELLALKGTEGDKQDSSVELMRQSTHVFPKSLWIMRHRHRLPSPSPVSVQCLKHRNHYLEAQTNKWSQKPQQNSDCHTENPESNLQVALSSEYCKRSEPMSSSFAKRLDSLIHPTALKNVLEYTSTNKFCIFCGICGHSIRECTEVIGTRLEHFLKTKPLCARTERASCFCILCFHSDHWAASCPNVSSKGNLLSCNANGFDDVNFRNSPEKHQNHHSANHDGAIMLWSASKMDHHRMESRSKKSDFVVSTSISCHKNESGCYGTLDLHVNQVEHATNMDKLKVTDVFLSQNEVKKSEVTPFSSHLSTNIASEPGAIFVVVRKLRLSRLDIIRWMKSPSHINLTGLFLRLRIGKLEKGVGGTRYHVACINGANSERSIFVIIGSSTYSVTSRFISNQDFNEDELNTWWFQKLRDGGQMPSTEELDEKLQLKTKFECVLN